MALTRRDIAAVILLSIFTCGIYSIYWFVVTTNEIQASLRDPDGSVSSGGTAFLFSILTCSIYQLYWYYKQGSRIARLQEQAGLPVTDNGVLYLVLAFFRLTIISDAIIQDSLNNIIDAGFKDSGSDDGWGNNGGGWNNNNNNGGDFDNSFSSSGLNNRNNNGNPNNNGGFNNSFGNSGFNNYGNGGENRSDSQYPNVNYDGHSSPYGTWLDAVDGDGCPNCGSKDSKYDHTRDSGQYYRICSHCGQRFKTI